MRNFKYLLFTIALMFSAQRVFSTHVTVDAGNPASLISVWTSAITVDTVFIPAGTYDISSSGVIFSYANTNTTSIVVVGSGKDITSITGGAMVVYSSKMDISDIKVVNGGGSFYGTDYAGIHVLGRPFTPPATLPFTSTVTLESVIIDNCTLNGGVIFDSYSYSTSITNSEFNNNSSSLNGAAISFSEVSSDLTVENCSFDSNEATSGTGGAIYFPSLGANVDIENCDFTGNTSTTEGGALYFYSASSAVSITGSNFTGNGATLDGGAIASPSISAAFTLDSILFDSNTSSEGGATCFDNVSGTLTIDDCVYSNNESTTIGGALCINAITSTLSLNRTEFLGNLSNTLGSTNTVGVGPGAGAALYVDGINGNLSFINNAFYNNSGGYAILMNPPIGGGSGQLTVQNNSLALNPNGGVYFYGSFSGFTGNFNNNLISDNAVASGLDMDAASSFSLNGNYNIIESYNLSNITITGSENTLGVSADYLDMTVGEDSLIHTSTGQSYVLAKLSVGEYPTLDLYGNSRDTKVSDIGATEVALDTIAYWVGPGHSWSTASNWKNSKSPVPSGSDVSAYSTIYIVDRGATGYPVITDAVDLAAGGHYDNASLDISSTAILRNGGDVQFENITVHSDSDGTGQYITESTGSMTVTGVQAYEQKLIGGQWNFLCIPEAMTPDDLLLDYDFGGAWSSGSFSGDYWISTYDEAARAENGPDEHWVQVTSDTATLEANTGCLVWVDDSLVVTFDNVPGQFTGALSYETGAADTADWGWNMIGNPNSIAWKIDEFLTANENVGSVYWHNGTYYQSRVIGAGAVQFIPAHQAFFVQADSLATSYVMATDQADYSNSVDFKSSSVDIRNVMTIALSVGQESVDETILRVRDDATEGFDFRLDAYELNEMAMTDLSISSHLNGVDYSINSVSDAIMDQSIPLQVGLPVGAESFEFSFELEGLDGVNAYLLDTETNERTLIVNGVSMPKTLADADVLSRFEIEFSYDVVTEAIDIEDNTSVENTIRVFSSNETLTVVSENKLEAMDVMAYDLLGKVVAHQTINGGSGVISGLADGVYLIKVTQANTTESHKVMVQ